MQADTTTLAPTDAEIEAAYRKVWSTVPHAQRLSAFAHEIASTLAARWGAPAPASGEPAAYRLKDDEATKHYGKDVYVYYTPNEFKTPAAFKYLEPLYTASVLLDRIARDLLFDVKNRVNALVLLPSSERRESEIRIKQDIADFLAAPQAQEAQMPLSDEHLYRLWRDCQPCNKHGASWHYGRAIEAAHGITAAQKETP